MAVRVCLWRKTKKMASVSAGGVAVPAVIEAQVTAGDARGAKEKKDVEEKRRLGKNLITTSLIYLVIE